MHKQVFRDALCLHYGWPLSRLPPHCVCGVPFSIDHAFSCPQSVFPIIRHNRIKDLQRAELLTEVCPCVAVELVLQPLSGESFQHHSTNTEDNARLDVCAREFWDKSRATALFDVRVFNAHVPSNGSLSTTSCYRKHEMEKRRKYKRRVIGLSMGLHSICCVHKWRNGTFCFSHCQEAGITPGREIRHPYSTVMNVIRSRLSLSLLDSLIMCIRGARSSFRRPVTACDTPALIAAATE